MNADEEFDRAFRNKAIGLAAGQIAMYFLLRKLDAPRWAAYGVSVTAANAAFAPYKYAYDTRKLYQKLLAREIEKQEKMVEEQQKLENLVRERRTNN